MLKRYVSVWFKYLKTDWISIRKPEYLKGAFVMHTMQKGRVVITAANHMATALGIGEGMVLADAKAMVPGLLAAEDQQTKFEEVLKQIAVWFIRYSPVVAPDGADGIMLDASGCTHLWGSEEAYLTSITNRLKNMGYSVRAAMAGTMGTAWALCRYSNTSIAKNGEEAHVLSPLPCVALRIDGLQHERLQKLGLLKISDVLQMPVPVLRRRFGVEFITKLQQALGYANAYMLPIEPLEPYVERLTCLDPIVTLPGIELALKHLLTALCKKLENDGKGLRTSCLKTFGVDGDLQSICIGTNKPTCNKLHIFKLFEMKLQTLAPGLGIELFTLDATTVEDHFPLQEEIWSNSNVNDNNLALLIDKLTNKIGGAYIGKYVAAEHYWPERAIKRTEPVSEILPTAWPLNHPRPILILQPPKQIVAMAISDDAPSWFKLNGKLHNIVTADGPERIAAPWWLEASLPRDYFYVEDEEGCRYWIYRVVQPEKQYQNLWFLHGYFP